MKAIINCAISIKEIVLVVHDTSVKLNVMWKLDGMNITSAEKKTNHDGRRRNGCFNTEG